MGTCLLAVFLLYRNVTLIGRISEYLWVGVMLTIAWVIVLANGAAALPDRGCRFDWSGCSA